MLDLHTTSNQTASPSSGFVYQGDALRHTAMPMGGLGTGQIALGGDGGLRQWQMVNQINHRGFVPDSFFALRVSCTEPPLDVVRILQSQEILQRDNSHTPLVNDDEIPADQLALVKEFGGVERTLFTGAYPFARIAYEDSQLPLDISLEAYSPFIPLDAAASGLPAIIFTFTLHNRSQHSLHGGLGATLQNAVGWDGVTPTSGNQNPLYGGNINRLQKRSKYWALVMENANLPDDHPGAGQMVLASLSPSTHAYERWTRPEHFIHFMQGFNPERHMRDQDWNKQRGHKNSPVSPTGPSPVGQTWNGGLLAPFWLKPGESVTLRFIISWHFPNRYVNFDQFGPRRDYGKSRFWVGNEYATRFSDAIEVVEYILAQQQQLEEKSRAWSNNISASSLPNWLSEALAAQGTLMRSPTCFRAEDGKFFGFEGSLGASTNMWNGNYGGSCPLNCTHVWNYEQALSRLFPELERTMRETEFDHVQSPQGYISHRTILPLYLPQLWNVPIGGPTSPALDGMLGSILKTYREVRQGAGRVWLERYWPSAKLLIKYIIARWDADGDGVLEGEQPNTYDIAFYGANMYIGALWLAALRAAEEMAKLQGEQEMASELRQLFERGSARYDELLWNGEYYIQLVDPAAPPEDQFGEGCLADQLFGQWWAHLLDLGYILPEEHVKTTLRSIVTYNFHQGFRGFEHGYRVFADQDDAGLLVCTWPRGGRPEIPVRYCDEVWTGIEYQVAAHCIMEGMTQEGMKILAALRQRYNGTRRNPYNEIECGDHYSRAMAGWSVLEALSGYRYNALTNQLTFTPVDPSERLQVPFIAAQGWGVFAHTHERITLTCSAGTVEIASLKIHASEIYNITARKAGASLPLTSQWQNRAMVLHFEQPCILEANEELVICFSNKEEA